jgi:DNA-binding YbaB/EbfC family protein
MNKMQQMLSEMQKKMEESQKELEKKEVTGSSGAGLVTVVLSVSGIVKKVTIDPSVINPEEKEILEDLIAAALNDAKSKAEKLLASAMSEITNGVDIHNLKGLI